MEPFNFAQYQSRICQAVVRSGREEGALEAILELLQRSSSEAETLIEEHPGDRSMIACAPGCGSCCVVNVSTLLPEGFAIVRHLQKQAGRDRKLAAERLDKLWREVRGLDDDERLFVRRPCSFLNEQGSCRIYPVRPLLCRSLTSTSAESCREALAGKILGEETAVLSYQFQSDLYETLFTGFAAGLERHGSDGRSFPLTGLIRYLLQHPEAEQEWLLGRQLSWQDIY